MKLFYQEIVKEQIFTMNIDRNQIWRAGSTVGQNKEKSSMHFNFEAMLKKRYKISPKTIWNFMVLQIIPKIEFMSYDDFWGF